MRRRPRLIQRRKTVGYTQEKLAEELGVDRTTVVRWERAESEPQPWQRPRLGALLGVSAEELNHMLLEVVELPVQHVVPGHIGDVGTPPLIGRAVAVPSATAPGVTAEPDEANRLAREFADKLTLIRRVVDVSPDEAVSIARLADNLIELELNLDIDIGGDGRARLVYRHTLINIGMPPATRMAREVWFKHTEPPIRIQPVPIGETRMVIQRVHDTPTLAKFACQMSPALQPGATATVQYTVTGGLFVDEFYWRQTTPRYVRHLVIRLRHRGAGRLDDCAAVEEHPDGSENSAAEELRWDHEGSDIVVTLTRDHLRPNQAVTLRWEFDREAAR